MMETKTFTVLGAGYVGLTTATLLAHCGHKVYLIEPNKKRLDVIKQGRSFFYENGLDSVIKLALDAGNLIPIDSYKKSVPHSSVVFSCVGTPDNPDGSSNLTYVFGAAEEVAKHAKPDTIFVQKSTVPIGTGKKVEEMFKKSNKKIDYVSNPEFLREGTAIYDTLYFDRVVVGGNNKSAVNVIIGIYMGLEKFRDHIAHIANVPVDPRGDQYIATGLNSAELIKVTANAFLALKITFANSTAKLADAASADINEVMDAVGADPRIGRAFLNAGRGYGGGCFPKDVSGLISSGLSYGIDLNIMQEVQNENNSMPGYIIEKLNNKFNESLTDKKVAVLGLAFKSGTSDVRKSPGITMANTLADSGAIVTAYDPKANDEASGELNKSVRLCESVDEATEAVEAIIVATDWPEFLEYSTKKYAKNAKIFVDAMNRFSPNDIKATGLNYIGVGRS